MFLAAIKNLFKANLIFIIFPVRWRTAMGKKSWSRLAGRRRLEAAGSQDMKLPFEKADKIWIGDLFRNIVD